LLRIHPSFTIYSASNGNEVLDLLYSKMVDIIFIDIRMPFRDGIETTRSIRKFDKHVKIVVVSMIDDRATVQKVFKAGANGYLHKNTDKNQLKKVIDVVMQNEIFLCDELAIYRNDINLNDHFQIETPEYEVILTDREIIILQLICKQCSSKEIGIRLNLSEKTIESLRNKLMLKTRSKNVAGLIMFAIDNGYISSDHKKIV
jgi:two-component system response regulator DegU